MIFKAFLVIVLAHLSSCFNSEKQSNTVTFDANKIDTLLDEIKATGDIKRLIDANDDESLLDKMLREKLSLNTTDKIIDILNGSLTALNEEQLIKLTKSAHAKSKISSVLGIRELAQKPKLLKEVMYQSLENMIKTTKYLPHLEPLAELMIKEKDQSLGKELRNLLINMPHESKERFLSVASTKFKDQFEGNELKAKIFFGYKPHEEEIKTIFDKTSGFSNADLKHFFSEYHSLEKHINILLERPLDDNLFSLLNQANKGDLYWSQIKNGVIRRAQTKNSELYNLEQKLATVPFDQLSNEEKQKLLMAAKLGYLDFIKFINSEDATKNFLNNIVKNRVYDSILVDVLDILIKNKNQYYSSWLKNQTLNDSTPISIVTAHALSGDIKDAIAITKKFAKEPEDFDYLLKNGFLGLFRDNNYNLEAALEVIRIYLGANWWVSRLSDTNVLSILNQHFNGQTAMDAFFAANPDLIKTPLEKIQHLLSAGAAFDAKKLTNPQMKDLIGKGKEGAWVSTGAKSNQSLQGLILESLKRASNEDIISLVSAYYDPSKEIMGLILSEINETRDQNRIHAIYNGIVDNFFAKDYPLNAVINLTNEVKVNHLPVEILLNNYQINDDAGNILYLGLKISKN